MFERRGVLDTTDAPLHTLSDSYIALGPVSEVISGESRHFTHRRKCRQCLYRRQPLPWDYFPLARHPVRRVQSFSATS